MTGKSRIRRKNTLARLWRAAGGLNRTRTAYSGSSLMPNEGHSSVCRLTKALTRIENLRTPPTKLYMPSG